MMILSNAIIFALFLIINPCYLIILFSILNFKKNIPFQPLSISIAISIFIANRMYGVKWGSGDNFANDDAINYFKIYEEIKNNLGGMIQLYEPIYLIMLKTFSIFELSTLEVSILSVFIPLFALVYFIKKSDIKYKYLLIAILFGLFPTMWEVFFHNWRLALGFPFFLSIILNLGEKNLYFYIKFLIAVLSHLSYLFFLIPILIYKKLKPAFVINYFYIIIASLIIIPLLSIDILIDILSYTEKIKYYLNINYSESFWRNYHILILIIVIILIFINRNTISGLVIALSIPILLFGLSTPSFVSTVIFYRLSILIFPTLSIYIYRAVINNIYLSQSLILLVITYNIYLYKITTINMLNPVNVYSYISKGNFYNIFSGIISNLKGLFFG